DVTLAPITARLDPERRPALVASVGVLEVVELAFTLQQSEALRVRIDEGRYLQRARIRERTPDALAMTIQNLQSVRVVHGIAIVVEARAVRRVEQEHRRQRRDTEGRQVRASKQLR